MEEKSCDNLMGTKKSQSLSVVWHVVLSRQEYTTRPFTEGARVTRDKQFVQLRSYDSRSYPHRFLRSLTKIRNSLTNVRWLCYLVNMQNDEIKDTMNLRVLKVLASETRLTILEWLKDH